MKIKLLLLGAVSAGALATASLADSITVVGCDEGLLEEIDASTLPDGLDGTPASEDFMDKIMWNMRRLDKYDV